mmetsp:Transcript_51461/g.168278  ORF Transcript_51461/g.168278 Transcript_51461/m.168278 type:complete len:524 (+) Transcript_51461:102-1673(+)
MRELVVREALAEAGIKRRRSSGGEPATRLSAHLLELFEEIDCDPAVCRISAEELRRGLERLGLPCSPNLVDEIFDLADANADGQLDYGDLLVYATEREAQVARTFARIARDGRIRRGELQQALGDLGLRVSAEQAQSFFDALDRNGSGTVTLDEFEQFCWLLPRVDARAAFESWQKHVPLDTGQEPGLGLVAEKPLADGSGSSTPASPAPPLVVLAAGAVAGVVSRTATAPLDRLKVLMQVGSHEVASVDGSVRKLGPVAMIERRAAASGVLAGLRAIYAAGGVPAFFQGNLANVVKIVPESALKFWVYDWVKRLSARDYSRPTASERLLAGAAAGAASCTAIYPLEVVKTRMAIARAGEYEGIGHCLQRTARAEGLRALYKGLPASLAGIIPFSAVDLALFNTLKEWLARYRRREPDVLTLLGCGALSSTVAQLATYPLALAKTRLQAAGMPGYPQRYNGLADCLRQTYSDREGGGVRALYRGILPNMLKAVPAISISYVVFETSKKAMLSRIDDQRRAEPR